MTDTEIADFRWNGYRCDLLAFQLDQAEHERRQVAGLGALASFTLLEPLMTLPEGCPIPWDAVDPRYHKTLRRFAADWAKLYAQVSPGWVAPSCGISANDWPTGPDAAELAPRKPRLRLIIGELVDA